MSKVLQENNSAEEPNSTTLSRDSSPAVSEGSSVDTTTKNSEASSSVASESSPYTCPTSSSEASGLQKSGSGTWWETREPSKSTGCEKRSPPPPLPFKIIPPEEPVSLDSSSAISKTPVKSILQPSVLSKPILSSQSAEATPSGTTLSPFVLNPPKLTNPFAKSFNGAGLIDSADVTSSSEVSSSVNVGSESKTSEVKEGKVSSSASSHVFVPLATAPSTIVQSTPLQSLTPSRYVFGQNLHERVAIPQETTEAASPESSRLEQSSEVAASSNEDGEAAAKTNGTTSQMLFSSVLQKEAVEIKSSENCERKSLSEAAREYEEARAVKRKYEEVQVVTGEEEESNVLQINCKLFAFNNESGSWTERGRGTLRVNDKESGSKLTSSRVVVRTVGNLRVVLNTKIWSGMTVKKPSEKSVQITAMDSSGQIKIFLIMASPKDADQLYKALDWRVSNQKKIAASDSEGVKKACVSEGVRSD